MELGCYILFSGVFLVRFVCVLVSKEESKFVNVKKGFSQSDIM